MSNLYSTDLYSRFHSEAWRHLRGLIGMDGIVLASQENRDDQHEEWFERNGASKWKIEV